MKKKVCKRVLRVLLIFLGAAIYAAGVAFFLEPNRLVSGGVGGISIILSSLTPLSTGTWVLVLNVPLLFLALLKLGKSFFCFTLLGVGFSSAFLNLYEALSLPPVTDDRLLSAFAGGSLIALGLGIVFRARATTGGSDIAVRLLKLRFPHVKTGVLILVLDLAVIVASVFAFRELELGLYAALGVFIQAFVFDRVLYGSDSAKLVYIVTSHPEQLTRAFLKTLSVGVTSIRATGSYTGEDRMMLLCAMHQKVLPQARVLVRDLDPQAFLIVTPATQIFGEGFLHHDREEL